MLGFMNIEVIFDFNQNSDLGRWKVVDDEVMGGRSSGTLELSPEGHGVFAGKISLENNGGFSSVRYQFPGIDVHDKNTIVLKVKGDGRKYQLRVKHSTEIYYSYIRWFETSGEWEEISIPLDEIYPSLRGRTLDLPNFSHATIEEIGLLTGSKDAGDFQLLIDRIELK